MITLFKQHPGQLLQHLRHRFEPSATCACAVTVPHLPCITLMLLAPFSLTAATYINNIALVAGLSVMAAASGYGYWYRRRQPVASRAEHAVTLGTSIFVALLMIGLHLPGNHLHHHSHAGPGADMTDSQIADFEALSRTLDCRAAVPSKPAAVRVNLNSPCRRPAKSSRDAVTTGTSPTATVLAS
jgi:hypothetical protein